MIAVEVGDTITADTRSDGKAMRRGRMGKVHEVVRNHGGAILAVVLEIPGEGFRSVAPERVERNWSEKK